MKIKIKNREETEKKTKKSYMDFLPWGKKKEEGVLQIEDVNGDEYEEIEEMERVVSVRSERASRELDMDWFDGEEDDSSAVVSDFGSDSASVSDFDSDSAAAAAAAAEKRIMDEERIFDDFAAEPKSFAEVEEEFEDEGKAGGGFFGWGSGKKDREKDDDGDFLDDMGADEEMEGVDFATLEKNGRDESYTMDEEIDEDFSDDDYVAGHYGDVMNDYMADRGEEIDKRRDAAQGARRGEVRDGGDGMIRGGGRGARVAAAGVSRGGGFKTGTSAMSGASAATGAGVAGSGALTGAKMMASSTGLSVAAFSGVKAGKVAGGLIGGAGKSMSGLTGVKKSTGGFSGGNNGMTSNVTSRGGGNGRAMDMVSSRDTGTAREVTGAGTLGERRAAILNQKIAESNADKVKKPIRAGFLDVKKTGAEGSRYSTKTANEGVLEGNRGGAGVKNGRNMDFGRNDYRDGQFLNEKNAGSLRVDDVLGRGNGGSREFAQLVPRKTVKETIAEIEEKRAEQERQAKLALAQRQLLAMQKMRQAQIAEQRAAQEEIERERKEIEAREMAEKQRLARLKERPHFINTDVDKRPLSGGVRRTAVNDGGRAARTEERNEGLSNVSESRTNYNNDLSGLKVQNKGEAKDLWEFLKIGRQKNRTEDKKIEQKKAENGSKNISYADKLNALRRERREEAERPVYNSRREQHRNEDEGRGVVIVPALTRKTVNMPLLMAGTILAGAMVGVLAYFMFLN